MRPVMLACSRIRANAGSRSKSTNDDCVLDAQTRETPAPPTERLCDVLCLDEAEVSLRALAYLSRGAVRCLAFCGFSFGPVASCEMQLHWK